MNELGRSLNIRPFVRASSSGGANARRRPAAAVESDSPGTHTTTTTTSGSSPGAYTSTTDTTPERGGKPATVGTRAATAAAAAAALFELSDDSTSILSSADYARGAGGSERSALHKALTMARQDNRALRSQIDRMRARELEIVNTAAATTAQLEALSRQMEGIKRRVRQELCHPVDEATYTQLVSDKTPSELDLFDTIRVAVFRQIGELQQSRDAARRELGDKAERYAAADDFARKARLEMEQLQRAHQHEVGGLQDQIDVWRNRCEQNELAAKTAALTRDANEGKAARFDALEAELRRATAAGQAAEEERARLQQRCTHATEELAQLRGELQREQLLLHNTQTELKFAAQKADMLAERVREVDDARRRATTELDELRASRAAAGGAVGAEREALRASFEESLRCVQERSERMRQEEVALATRAAEHGAERQCALLRDARDAAQTELGRVRQQLADSAAAATAQREEMQARLHKADKEIFELRIDVANRTNDSRRHDLAAQEAAAEIDRLRSDRDRLQKQLDLLKQEFYDQRAMYQERAAQLQSKVEGMEGQLEMFRSLEAEAEVFMQHLAESSGAGNGTEHVRALMDVPSSRRAAHTISVTKRCLALENQVSLLRHEAGVAELRHQRVAEELERARAALGDSNSPYLLLEKGIAQRDDEIQRLKDRVRIGEAELAAAQRTAAALAQDVKVMYAHRAEVLRLRDALRGAAAGSPTAAAAAAADGGEMDAAIARAAAAMSSSSSPAAASDGKKKKKGAADASAVSVGAAAATATAAPEDGYFEFN